MIRFITRLLIAFGFHHDENCPGKLVIEDSQFGLKLKCDHCNYWEWLRPDGIGEG